ncbi:MAG: phenylalanine 4-monooxygenase [Ginsengibacter sp.]
MKKSTVQIYSDYTTEDFQVWKILFNRQMETLQPYVSESFLAAMKIINFSAKKIPHFEETNAILNDITGWQLTVVPELSPAAEFFSFLAEKRFTATCWLRSLRQLDYIEEPDMFHDVFAHGPLLANKSYAAFFEKLGRLAIRFLDDEEIIKKIQRIYWFTIEFGLIKEGGEEKIYGAGIISSKEETAHVLSADSIKKSFDIDVIMAHDFRTDILQDTYYVIDSFAQLENVLDVLEEKLCGELVI